MTYTFIKTPWHTKPIIINDCVYSLVMDENKNIYYCKEHNNTKEYNPLCSNDPYKEYENIIFNLTKFEFQQFYNLDIYFDWQKQGMGFGQYSFYLDKENQVIHCSNECCSKETIRKMLHDFADYIADNMVLEN